MTNAPAKPSAKAAATGPAEAAAEPSANPAAKPALAKPVAPARSLAPLVAPRTIREERIALGGKRRRASSKAEVNPLREGLRLERVPDPHITVLFGSTGDLSHRKVFPALAQLWRTNLLPADWGLIAVGRRPFDDQSFRVEVSKSLKDHSRVALEPDMERQFLDRITYHLGDFSDSASYDALSAKIEGMHLEQGTEANVLFYLATQPSAFPLIVSEIGRCGMDHEVHGGGWRRIVVEKPFGRDLDSAKKLNREMLRVFRETQIYRIDHYLGKETVRNLMVFRFANGIFEPLWNRRYVDHVQITVAESLGIEDRGAFYEETGAVRDVLQNHLLQLLSLVAMEPPATLAADALRDEKLKVLRAVNPASRSDVGREIVRGQYADGWVAGTPVPGYRAEMRSMRTRRPRPSSPAGSRSTTGAGPGSRFTCVRASAWPSAPRRSRSNSARCRTASLPRPRRTRSPTCSRSESSRTRGSCSGSAPRCPASGSRSARSRWTSPMARRSPRTPRRPTRP